MRPRRRPQTRPRAVMAVRPSAQFSLTLRVELDRGPGQLGKVDVRDRRGRRLDRRDRHRRGRASHRPSARSPSTCARPRARRGGHLAPSRRCEAPHADRGHRPHLRAAPRRQDLHRPQARRSRRATTSRWPTRRASRASAWRSHEDRREGVRVHDQGEHRGRGLRRHRGARPRRHRPRGRHARDGGQGDAVQGVRATSTPSRSASTPRTRTRSSQTVKPHRPHVRRHQPRGHLLAALLRDRAAGCSEELDIPVFHDDQHGTAIVVLAALINACRLTGRRLEDLDVAMVGAGAAGVAVAKILMDAGVTLDRRLRPLRRDPHRPRRLPGRAR